MVTVEVIAVEHRKYVQLFIGEEFVQVCPVFEIDTADNAAGNIQVLAEMPPVPDYSPELVLVCRNGFKEPVRIEFSPPYRGHDFASGIFDISDPGVFHQIFLCPVIRAERYCQGSVVLHQSFCEIGHAEYASQ